MSNIIQTSPLAAPGKYLTLMLGHEAYGISVLKVREIIRHQKVTPVPGLASYVTGVINLRGRVIAVIDLRVKFDLPAQLTDRTCVVVVQIQRSSGVMLQAGLIVDAVEEVAILKASDIEPTPEFGAQLATTFLLGMAKVKGQLKMLLDIDRLLDTDLGG